MACFTDRDDFPSLSIPLQDSAGYLYVRYQGDWYPYPYSNQTSRNMDPNQAKKICERIHNRTSLSPAELLAVARPEEQPDPGRSRPARDPSASVAFIDCKYEAPNNVTSTR